MHQDFERRVEDLLFERDGLHAHPDWTALQLLAAPSSRTVLLEGFELPLKCSAASHLHLVSPLSSLVSRFIDVFSRFVSSEVAAHQAHLVVWSFQLQTDGDWTCCLCGVVACCKRMSTANLEKRGCYLPSLRVLEAIHEQRSRRSTLPKSVVLSV